MSDVYQQMRPVTLTFRDPAVEAHFRAATLPLLRWHGRLATLVGVLVYVMFGMLDPYYIPSELHADVWTIRGLGILVTLMLMSLSWTRWYQTIGSWCLMLTGATAGLSLLSIFWILPAQALEYYYAGLILLSFFTFNFSGTRFVLALGCNVMLLVAYNVLFVYLQERPRDVWLSHNLHLFSAGILGGTAAYLAEYRQRQLYLVRSQLTRDRSQARHEALHDPLTGLPNRVLLLDRLSHALSQSRRSGKQGAVLFVDLDGFKGVNDDHGHAAGDEVLRQVAKRMRDCLRESDTLSRMGGDEFVVLTEGVGSEAQLHALIDKLRAEIEQPCPVPSAKQPKGTRVWISASVGACFFPKDDATADDLLQRADEAMYRAKRSGRSVELGQDAA